VQRGEAVASPLCVIGYTEIQEESMQRHLPHERLVRLFSGQAAPPEVEGAVPHLSACQPCWTLAARVVAQLKAQGTLVRLKDSRAAVLALLQEEERHSTLLLRARAWWAELKELSPERQTERVRTVAALQTGEVFEVILDDARETGLTDPYAGEHAALTAHGLLDLLSPARYPTPLIADYKSEAMVVVANCRRLAGDWPGSRAAISAARNHLQKGTGDPRPEAYLLSIHASLACDLGNLEMALGLMARAAEVYGKLGDLAGVAKIRVQEANVLFEATQAEEALEKTKEALDLLTPAEGRLEFLARSIMTLSLLLLGRLSEALRSWDAARPLVQQLSGGWTSLRVNYVEARLLDALGCAREAEKLYREAANGFAEAEIYRTAFFVRLDLFQSLFRRGALDKAARLCKESIQLLEQTGLAHDQMKQVWRNLLQLLTSQALKDYHVAEVQRYLSRYWASPAPRAPLKV
jgi:tetratricopeptide (TPR) repeat protein